MSRHRRKRPRSSLRARAYRYLRAHWPLPPFGGCTVCPKPEPDMCAQSLRDASRERPSPLSEAPLQRCARAPLHPQHKGQGRGMGSGLSRITFTPQGRWVVCGSWGGQTPAWFTRLHIAYSRPQGRSSFTSSSSCSSSRRTSWRRGEAPTARHHLRQSSGSITRCVSNVRPLTNVRLVLGGAPR